MSLLLSVFKLCLVPILILLVWHFATLTYLNPYTLTFIFAKKGQGKSTLLTKLALQHKKRGWTVFTTENVPGTYHIDPSDIGYFHLPWRSVLLIDEVGLLWHSRDFKTFPKEIRAWFKLQRHRGVKVYMFSQSFDVDKSVRDLADDMYLLQKRFRIFSYGKRILKFMDIVEATGSNESDSRIVDQLKFDSLLFFWCGSRTLTYIPAWTKYFDSFAAPDLPMKDFELVPELSDCDPDDDED